jgi:aspartate ammonia-lyase
MSPPEESVLWGPETAKALDNFGSPDLEAIPRELIQAYGEVKLAALEGIQEFENYFDEKRMEILRRGAAALIRGDLDAAFPLPMAQGGAGTSFHMNVNEVLARYTDRELGDSVGTDAIEDLARYQSTNDTFGSASVIAAFRIVEKAEQSAVILQEILVDLEIRYDNILMTGRTELQDALPMRAGQLFGAWAGALERDRWRLSKVAERVREVPLGGTALGSGFGAPRGYTHAAERHLRRITDLPLARSQNMMDAVGMKDSLAEAAGALRLAALNISRICADLLYYSSAPVGEIRHPNLQYGSSMMPLKTNPVLLERSRGLAMSAIGEAQKVELFAREGQLQLNAYLPFLMRGLCTCGRELAIATVDLQLFLREMKLDEVSMEANLARSPAVLNALSPLVGYRSLKSLEETVLADPPSDLNELANLISQESGISKNDIAAAMKPANLTGPPRENI